MKIELIKGANKYSGFLESEFYSSINYISRYFELCYTQDSDTTNQIGFKKGDIAQIKIDNKLYLTGRLDLVRTSLGDNGLKITLVGRSKSAQLVDCSAPFEPGELLNQDALQIARRLCEPFGIEVKSSLASFGEKFPVWSINTGESVWSNLQRLAWQRGLLFRDSPDGSIVIDTLKRVESETSLQLGKNILTFDHEDSLLNRFSEYTILGQSKDDFHMKETAYDSEIGFYRPKVLISPLSTSRDQLRSNVAYEKQLRKQRGEDLTVLVGGWEDGESFFNINTLIKTNIPIISLNDQMLISGVRLKQSQSQGLSAELELEEKDSFNFEK